jgi:hypothetical protein
MQQRAGGERGAERVCAATVARWAGLEARAAEEDDADALGDGGGGPEALQVALMGVRGLAAVVDARAQAVWDIGHFAPCLRELRLDGSVLESLRDLGTELAGLRVLWVARCGLQSLDGVSALPRLEELFAAFNHVSDLSALAGHESLRVLDLEGNDLEHAGQLALLSTLPCLEELNLAGCPAADARDFRRLVAARAPWLRLLNDEPLSASDDVPAASGDRAGTDSEGWSFSSAGERKEEAGVSRGAGAASAAAEEEEQEPGGRRTPLSARGEERRRAEGGRRPQSARAARSGGGGGGGSFSSALTHGTDVVFAGNPALAFRKQRAERNGAAHVSILATLDSMRDLELAAAKARAPPQLLASLPVRSPPRPASAAQRAPAASTSHAPDLAASAPPAVPPAASDAAAHETGPAAAWTDHDLVQLLRRKPKTVPGAWGGPGAGLRRAGEANGAN